MSRQTPPPIPAAKREQILTAALEVFVSNGYVGTSTDQLAAAATVSKQTLYRAFGDKRGIFTALIRSVCDHVNDPFAPLVSRMREVTDPHDALDLLADRFTASILTPANQRLRRLVIAEAARFPELGRLYWESGFERMLTSIGQCLSVLDDRGLLSVPHPALAAEHFAGLLLWIPGNRGMFLSTEPPLDGEQVRRDITEGVAAFLRAYRTRE